MIVEGERVALEADARERAVGIGHLLLDLGHGLGRAVEIELERVGLGPVEIGRRNAGHADIHVEIEGVGLRLKSFKATSRSTTELELAEKTFLSAAVGNPILAVAIEQHNLKPKQSTRVFVVERKDLPAATMATLDTGVEP